jgi:2-polyprenyl-3-methyl-5-hydroxy-6-metoxy-1,4-benzoquinol methylase
MKFFKKDYSASYFDTVFESKHLKHTEVKQKAQLIRSLKPRGNLLEIGCGEGLLLKELKNDYNVSGIDISRFAIKRARSVVGRNMRVADIEKENIRGRYDIILAFDVLEHLKNPEAAIMKMKKALKNNGIFIFSVPNNSGLFGRISTMFFNYMDKTHVSAFKREKWIDIVKNAKFKLQIINQSFCGYSKSELAKHFSFNLVIIAHRSKN